MTLVSVADCEENKVLSSQKLPEEHDNPEQILILNDDS
jgi:hypothetical protein